MLQHLYDDQIQTAQSLRGGFKYHGKYCGPAWTAGEKIWASKVDDKQYNEVDGTDDLDRACKEHDYRCGKINADEDCHKADDQLLVDKAMRIVKGRYPMKLKLKAMGLATAIKGAKQFRGSGE
jgi:hypothetical protein